ncbi:hypothetical protein O3S73_019145 [Bacillus altitudinis]|uniref:hypothetical protein n=1 Tax=Bacillus altitudinis TaxID=293387 RepID=UPI00119CE787|nr:hypothetical protein [Bacillus altitudinis]MCY7718442.1 hypothetical protein [Bacillus altitudinis]MDR7671080.1 hypothetical protein [Bacillus altitudinis]
MKKFILAIMSIIMLVSFAIPTSHIKANTDNEVIDLKDLKPVELKEIKNLDKILSKYKLKKKNITSTYYLDEDKTGIINLYDKKKKVYFNFYIVNNTIEFQSIQKELNNGKTSFDLYTNEFENVISETADSNGEIEPKDTNENMIASSKAAKKPNKAAIKWACIFSSYIACLSVSAAAGAGGALISGPFGLASGFAGGLACRYVFQTLVEKYGGKKAACKLFS